MQVFVCCRNLSDYGLNRYEHNASFLQRVWNSYFNPITKITRKNEINTF